MVHNIYIVITLKEETAYYLSGFDMLDGNYLLVRSKIDAQNEAQISGYYYFNYLKQFKHYKHNIMMTLS